MHGGRMASAGGATSILVLAPAAAVTSSCPSTLFFKSGKKKKKKSAAATGACHGRRRRATPCRATTSGRGEGDSDGLLWLPRRDLLAGLTGVAAFPGLALADVPKVYEGCGAGESLVTDDLLGCDTIGGPPCPPPAKAGIQTVNFYELPPPKKVRVRRPAHELGPDEVRRYRNALAEMKERNVSDPSSFAAQAAIHEAYCDGHYHIDPTERNRAFDVHFSWLFAPWHRMYIYFYERMVNHYMERDGSGGGFALPYWNWDAPAGMAIPAMFKEKNSALNDNYRNPDHLDAMVDLDYLSRIQKPPVKFTSQPQDPEMYKDILDSNLSTVYNQVYIYILDVLFISICKYFTF
jgi:polyphenol oxidase